MKPKGEWGSVGLTGETCCFVASLWTDFNNYFLFLYLLAFLHKASIRKESLMAGCWKRLNFSQYGLYTSVCRPDISNTIWCWLLHNCTYIYFCIFQSMHSLDREPVSFSLPDDSILRLLESRKGERETQAFVKKRRQREKQSQEATQTQWKQKHILLPKIYNLF